MKQAIDLLDTIKANVCVKVCRNNMTLLHSKDFSFKNMMEKILPHLNQNEFITLTEFTEKTYIKNTLMGKILIDELLEEGLLVIDESDLDIRYYLNKILNLK